MRVNKTWIVLGVAVVVGSLTALAARNYLSNQMAEIEARSKGKTMAVVVAKTDLPRGARLTGETAAVRQVPREFAHSSSIMPDQFSRAEGQALAFPVKSGEPILWSLLEAKKAPTFSARLEPGLRAITVPIDEINSHSGMLEPGDLIDLICTLNRKSQKLTFPLLQRVTVIATGSRVVDDPKSGEKRKYTTVTLETTPENAQNLIRAREQGEITALLRNPDDMRPLVNPYGDIATLLGMGPADSIPVLYGGGSSGFKPEQLNLPNQQAMGGAVPSGQAPLRSNSPFKSDQMPAQSMQPVSAGYGGMSTPVVGVNATTFR